MFRDRRDQRSGGRSFGKRGFGGHDRQMYEATCAACGEACQVPFKPTGSKPVYCDDCFGKNNNRGERRDDRRDDRREKRSFGSGGEKSFDNKNQYKEQLDAIHSKLNQILEMLKQNGGKKSVAVEEKKVVEEKKPAKKATAKAKKTEAKTPAKKKAAKKK